MVAVYAIPTKPDNLTKNLLGSVGSILGTITDDNFPVLGEMSPVPNWIKISGITEPQFAFTVTTATGSAVPSAAYTQAALGYSVYDVELEQLSIAANDKDECRYCEIVDGMDWSLRSPENIVTAIQFGLSAGAYLKALYLAQLGSKQYPDHQEIQKYAHILAPAQVKLEKQPSQPEGTKDIQWLKANRSEYSGQWVALLHGELLGTSRTLKELIRQVGNPKGTQILVTQVV